MATVNKHLLAAFKEGKWERFADVCDILGITQDQGKSLCVAYMAGEWAEAIKADIATRLGTVTPVPPTGQEQFVTITAKIDADGKTEVVSVVPYVTKTAAPKASDSAIASKAKTAVTKVRVNGVAWESAAAALKSLGDEWYRRYRDGDKPAKCSAVDVLRKYAKDTKAVVERQLQDGSWQPIS